MVGCDDQPEAGDGQSGRYGVTERLVVLTKPGNAGGGKGPQFKADVESGEVQEIEVTLQNSSNMYESCGRRHVLKRRNDSDRDPGS